MVSFESDWHEILQPAGNVARFKVTQLHYDFIPIEREEANIFGVRWIEGDNRVSNLQYHFECIKSVRADPCLR